MSRSQTQEQLLLDQAFKIIRRFSSEYEKQMLLLEACVAQFASFNVNEYWKAFNIEFVVDNDFEFQVSLLKEAIANSGIPVPLAISSLACEPVPLPLQKKNGAFYTDYRIAKFIADDCSPYLNKDSCIADLAAGSGILLAAVAEQYYEKFPDNYSNWISNNVFAYDLSENALRGARIALSVHVSSVKIIKKMFSKWLTGDSLLSDAVPEKSFDIIVGNPPWGKVKASRYLFINSMGTEHVYGSDYSEYNKTEFYEIKEKYSLYSKKLKERYKLLGNAEPDMYMAFLQKALMSLKEGGHLSYLVPAGLIRSQGTETLRRYLAQNGKHLKYYLLDNKANYFAIDSRFKFVLVSQQRISVDDINASQISFFPCKHKNNSILHDVEVVFNYPELEQVREDLTIPECSSVDEKNLFMKISRNGVLWEYNSAVDISREIDMTNDKKLFCSTEAIDSIPVVEGRMVQQHRFGAKAYVSGCGRSAVWKPSTGKIKSHYYVKKQSLNSALKERVTHYRAGYCDIAGQTNERAMMSAIIPPNVVCGNKVPTLYFKNDINDKKMLFWVGVTNSFVFDWLVRRVINTTINYFLLFSIPFPKVDLDSCEAQNIISSVRVLANLNGDYYTGDEMPRLRAEIDIMVAQLYGITFDELKLIMEDFPLLDRNQPVINGEARSTVTRDLLFSVAEREYNNEASYYTERYRIAANRGAKAYIPTEMTRLCKRRTDYESGK